MSSIESLQRSAFYATQAERLSRQLDALKSKRSISIRLEPVSGPHEPFICNLEIDFLEDGVVKQTSSYPYSALDWDQHASLDVKHWLIYLQPPSGGPENEG
jgi:hypothetical protein